jgi:Ser/Thr protein kinase RdoA (MazF antagonist)
VTSSSGNYNTSLYGRVTTSCHVRHSHHPEPTLRSLSEFGRWIRFEISRRSRQLADQSIPPNVEHFLARGDIGLVHADLHGGNILVKDGRIAAIVDWAEAAWLPRIAEAYTLVTYIERDRCGCRAGLEALLATFNLDGQTIEAFKVLNKALTAQPDKEYLKDSWC